MTSYGTPPERESLYPAPHRAGDWEPAPPRRSSRLWLIPVAIGGVALIAALAALGLAVGHRSGTSGIVATDPDGTTVNAIQIAVGTCLAQLPSEGNVGRVTAVPCSTPHVAEAVASYSSPGDAWPGRDAVVSGLLDCCGSFIQPGYGDGAMFRPSDWADGLRWVAWAPTEKSWAANERTGLCLAYREAGVQGSFVASTATFAD